MFLFRFASEAYMNYMMGTRWSFSRPPLMLQKWHPNMRLESLKPEKVAVWVRFSCMRMQYWSTEILSKLASYVGKPLKANLFDGND